MPFLKYIKRLVEQAQQPDFNPHDSILKSCPVTSIHVAYTHIDDDDIIINNNNKLNETVKSWAGGQVKFLLIKHKDLSFDPQNPC